jgi:hypothetical protein
MRRAERDGVGHQPMIGISGLGRPVKLIRAERGFSSGSFRFPDVVRSVATRQTSSKVT